METCEPLVWSHVSKRYGDKVALADASGSVEPGGRFVLTGPSGSGKTTLLRLLLGLEKPTEGTITGIPRRAAVVFQENRLVEEATVWRNVILALPRRADLAPAREVLDELGLGDELGTVVGTLSGGMKRRVALARALVAGGDLLALDEPLTGLDDATKRQTVAVIERHLAGRTLLLITHDSVAGDALGGSCKSPPDPRTTPQSCNSKVCFRRSPLR